MDLNVLLIDLASEGDQLDAVVATLPDEDWRLATPAVGWTIAHQIVHLAWTDEVASRALDRGFGDERALLQAGGSDLVDRVAEAGARVAPARILGRWRRARRELLQALSDSPVGTRVPWVGPAMSPASMTTARLMETWAHGQDIRDTLQLPPAATRRLRHVADLGIRTRNYALSRHGLPLPTIPSRIELRAPDGAEVWSWGPVDAPERLSGPALDFCLVVTRRRSLQQVQLVVDGAQLAQWLPIAQAYAL
jgi:uncharacterized protein (TIGR03084 family)